MRKIRKNVSLKIPTEAKDCFVQYQTKHDFCRQFSSNEEKFKKK